MIDVKAAADALMAARNHAARLEPLSALHGVTLDDAYAVAEAIRRQRIARGERPHGYKIGLTNRGNWPKLGVTEPMWAPVWDTTVRLLDSASATLSLTGLLDPRIEPEIVFGFSRSPVAGSTDAELRACIDWLAPGYEIVHGHYTRPGRAVDSVADFGMHGVLLVGPTCAPGDFDDLSAELAATRIDLQCDDRMVEQGLGSVVLDSPFAALQVWLQAMARQTPTWTVQPGDVVTTGTFTNAWPVQAGQHWQTTVSDPRLSGLSLRLVD